MMHGQANIKFKSMYYVVAGCSKSSKSKCEADDLQLSYPIRFFFLPMLMSHYSYIPFVVQNYSVLTHPVCGRSLIRIAVSNPAGALILGS